MSDNLPNPYVGPRTFEEADKDFFFGREKEAKHLLSLVVAERLVLFYAQSGAGKSSLLHTRLRPGLVAEDFDILPKNPNTDSVEESAANEAETENRRKKGAGRVGGDLPEGITAVDNIFVFNLITSLETNLESSRHFTHTTLTEYLKAYREEHTYTNEFGDEKARVLIIDQFEEIVTTNLDRWQDREVFFVQLAEAMEQDPLLWVVLTLREDHVAAIEPYGRFMHGGMRKRFYMQRMKKDAALKAIKGPASLAGRKFKPEAADKLVDNLRKLQTQEQKTADDETVHPLGEFVEPVQLQVVCSQLWNNLNNQEDPPDEISEEDLETSGDVDTALAKFYEDTLTAVLPHAEKSELELRTWFERKLITEAGTRATVFMGKEFTATMPNETVRLLDDHFLLRAEPRAGGMWYELVHDRFVEPILQSNQAWRSRQNPLTQAAEAWDSEDRNPDLLLKDEQLTTTIATVDIDVLDQLVQEFLTASQQAQDLRELEATQREAEEQAKVARFLRRLTYALGIVILIAFVLAIFAYRGQRAAQEQADVAAEARSTAVAGQTIAEKSAQAAANAEATARAERAIAEERAQAAATAEANADAERAIAEEQRAIVEEINASIEHQIDIANSLRLALLSTNFRDSKPQLSLLLAIKAIRSENTFEAREALQRALSLSQLWRIFPNEDADIQAFDIEQLSQRIGTGYLAVSYSDGSIEVRTIPDGTPSIGPSNPIDEENMIYDIALIPDNPDDAISLNLIAADGLYLCKGDNVEIGCEAYEVTDGEQVFAQGMFSEDGNTAVTVDNNNFVQIHNLITVTETETIDIPQPYASLTAITLSSDGNHVSVSDSDGYMYVWDINNLADAEQIFYAGTPASALTFSPDNKFIASGNEWGEIQIWDVEINERSQFLPNEHSDQITALTYSRDGTLLMSGANDNKITVWNMDADAGIPLFSVQAHEGEVTYADFSSDGNWLATGGADRLTKLWSTEPQVRQTISLEQPNATVLDSEISNDGRYLLTGGYNFTQRNTPDNGLLQVWQTQTITESQRVDESNQLFGSKPDKMISGIAFQQNTPIVAFAENVSNADVPYTTTLRIVDWPELLESTDIEEATLGTIELDGYARDIDFSADGNFIALAVTDYQSVSNIYDADGAVAVLQLAEGEGGKVILNEVFAQPLTSWVRGVTFSPNNQYIAVLELNPNAEEFTIRLWHNVLEKQETIQTLENIELHSWRFPSGGSGRNLFAFGPSSNPQTENLFALAGPNNTVNIWDVRELAENEEGAAPISTLRDHLSSIVGITFNQDGTLLTTSTENGTIRFWDVPAILGNEGESEDALIHVIETPTTLGRVLKYSQDGRYLIASSGSGESLHFWPAGSVEAMMNTMLSTACTSARRDFTFSEWEAYIEGETYQPTCSHLVPDIAILKDLVLSGDYATVQEMIADIVNDDIDPDLTLAEVWAAVAKEYADEADYTEALDAWSQALELDESFASEAGSSLTELVRQIVGDVDIDTTLSILARIQELDPPSFEVFADSLSTEIVISDDSDEVNAVAAHLLLDTASYHANYTGQKDEALAELLSASELVSLTENDIRILLENMVSEFVQDGRADEILTALQNSSIEFSDSPESLVANRLIDSLILSTTTRGDYGSVETLLQQIESLGLETESLAAFSEIVETDGVDATWQLCQILSSEGFVEIIQSACALIGSEGNIIEPDTPVYSSIQESGFELWQFEGEEGQIVSIHMSKDNSELDTYLELYDPARTLLVSDDDSGDGYNSLIDSFPLPETGLYTILAKGFDDFSIGAYELVLTIE